MSKAPKIPSDSYGHELVPGGIKAVKTSARRSDAMSWLEPHRITVQDGFNVRVRNESYAAHVRELAESMKVDGFLIDKPVSVYVAQGPDGGDVIYLVHGHSRLEAALLAIAEGAPFDEIPVVFLPKSVNRVDMTVDLVKGNSGRPLSPLETALVVKRLHRMELSEAEISRRLGVTASYINGLLLLASAPPRVQRLVVDERVSAAMAIETLRRHGTEALSVLERANAAASNSGRGKVARRDLPGARLTSALKKSAPALYQAARSLSADPAYDQLAPETRAQLDALLASLQELDAASSTSPPEAD